LDVEPHKESDYEDWNDRIWQQVSVECLAACYELDDSGNFIRDHESQDAPKWRPSIHMPRWASRLTLNVTGVRAERLQDISEEDAKAEGIFYRHGAGWFYSLDSLAYGSARKAFFALWDSINADKHPWESNPWVWVYEFEVAEACV
jgi:hypothetical protein